MKKKSLALVLATGMAVTTFGGTGSAFADSKNVLSTKKYNETVQSPEFISGDLTGATGKKAARRNKMHLYLNEFIFKEVTP